MADDRRYDPGDFYRMCDRTGFKIRAKRTRKEWNGLIVSTEVWERRQPQDFVKGRPDYQMVPEARPRQTDVFLAFLTTTTTADAQAGTQVLQVVSSIRILINDKVQVMLDTGVLFSTTILSVPSATSIQLAAKLPYKVSSGALVEDTTAYAQPNIG